MKKPENNIFRNVNGNVTEVQVWFAAQLHSEVFLKFTNQFVW